MNVLMFMFAGSDTSRESHRVLLGILPDLDPSILEKVSPTTCPLLSHMYISP